MVKIILQKQSFEYTSKSQIIETTKEFPVDAGDSGTFDIKYTPLEEEQLRV